MESRLFHSSCMMILRWDRIGYFCEKVLPRPTNSWWTNCWSRRSWARRNSRKMPMIPSNRSSTSTWLRRCGTGLASVSCPLPCDICKTYLNGPIIPNNFIKWENHIACLQSLPLRTLTLHPSTVLLQKIYGVLAKTLALRLPKFST